MTELDLDDRLIREMADRNHRPKELWTIAARLLAVQCETCGDQWPCPTRQALIAWENAAAHEREGIVRRAMGIPDRSVSDRAR